MQFKLIWPQETMKYIHLSIPRMTVAMTEQSIGELLGDKFTFRMMENLKPKSKQSSIT